MAQRFRLGIHLVIVVPVQSMCTSLSPGSFKPSLNKFDGLTAHPTARLGQMALSLNISLTPKEKHWSLQSSPGQIRCSVTTVLYAHSFPVQLIYLSAAEASELERLSPTVSIETDFDLSIPMANGNGILTENQWWFTSPGQGLTTISVSRNV